MVPMVSNLEWMQLNELRNYPITDNLARLDIRGRPLPTDLVVDANIWYPDTLGGTVVISSIGVTSGLVSITFAVGSTTFRPLAALTVPRPINLYRNYRVTPMIPGVSGWVAFGSGVNKHGDSWLFDPASDGVQTSLLPRCARSYEVSGVSSLSHANNLTPLYGDIKIVSGAKDKLVITKEAKTINGQTVNALVFRLNEAVSGPSIYSQFVRPCGKSPDSDTCNKPAIWGINGAVPDCDGIITLKFTEPDTLPLGSLLVLTPVDGEDGTNQLVVDFMLGMDDMCAQSPDRYVIEQLSKCESDCDIFSADGPFVDYEPRFGESL